MSQTAVSAGSVEQLTPRQREVLALLARGATNFEIAQALGISLEGAKYHVREIMGRLGVDSREDAADWWREERKPVARARRGLGWLLPRFIVAAAFLAAIAFAGIVVAFGIAASGGGGRPASAYAAACGEGDLKVEVDSRLRTAAETGRAPAVLVDVRFEPADNDCYLGGNLSLSPAGAAPTSADTYDVFRLSASTSLDTILDGGGTVTFTIADWCGESALPVDLTARLPGTQVQHRIDHPAEPCPPENGGRLCFVERGQPTECPPSQPSMSPIGPTAVRTMDLLDRCDPQRILVGVDSDPRAMQVPTGLPVPPAESPHYWRAQAMYENTAFALTWSVAERPLDCEFQSGVTLRLLDAGGNEVEVDREGASMSILARFRRATLPTDGAGRMIHVPKTGGNGDYATETSVLTHKEGGQFIWANWCGEDRTPVTLEVTAASGRARSSLERPPCIDAAQPSVLFSGAPFEAP